MKQTANYQLNQWEQTDRIQMADFNADNSRVDQALSALAANGAKIAAGSYTGSGGTGTSTAAATQTVPLAFAPRAVFVYPAAGVPYEHPNTYGYHNVYAALAVQGQPAVVSGCTALALTETGFTVNYQSKTASLGSYSAEDRAALNYGGKVFHYIALG